MHIKIPSSRIFYFFILCIGILLIAQFFISIHVPYMYSLRTVKNVFMQIYQWFTRICTESKNLLGAECYILLNAVETSRKFIRLKLSFSTPPQSQALYWVDTFIDRILPGDIKIDVSMWALVQAQMPRSMQILYAWVGAHVCVVRIIATILERNPYEESRSLWLLFIQTRSPTCI